MSELRQSLLSVGSLTVSFRADGTWRRVVNDLAFSLGENETLAIVGESGSGKSVTALALMGLVPTVNGRVEGEAMLSGRDLLGLSEHDIRPPRSRSRTPAASSSPARTALCSVGGLKPR